MYPKLEISCWHVVDLQKSTFTMGCYSAIKRSEIILFVARWMDLEITVLREVRQSKTNII